MWESASNVTPNPPFRLVRYVSVSSLVAFCIVTVALAVLYRHRAEADLVLLEQNKNVALTQAFGDSLWEQFAPFVHQARQQTAEQLRRSAETARLDQWVRAQTVVNPFVVKVKLYNLDGRTVFSSEPGQIGEEKGGNAGFQRARGGHTVSELTFKDTFSAFEGVIEERNLLSSYVPIRPGGPGTAVEGVLELYSDMTPLLDRIAKTQRELVLFVTGTLGLLYLVLLLIVRRAEALLKGRELERARAEYIAQENAERFRVQVEHSPDAIVVFETVNGRLLEANANAVRMFGLGRRELLGCQMNRLAPVQQPHGGRSDALLAERIVHALAGETQVFEWHVCTAAGQEIVTEMRLACLPSGERPTILATLSDIRERKHTEDELRLAASVFDDSTEGIIITDPKGIILRVNRAFSRITGYLPGEAVGNTPRILRSGRHDEAFYQNMWASIIEAHQWQGEIWNRRKNGEVYPEWRNITAVVNSRGEVAHYISSFTDISEKKLSEERLYQLAHYDVLTALPNRALFNERLGQTLTRAERYEESVALLFIDLDRFKLINDNYGHPLGDRLLQAVAERLRGCVRQSDNVARLAGDEFTVLLDRLAHGEAENVARTAAEKVLQALAPPFDLEGNEIFVTPSIGISLYPSDCKDAATLLRNADTALYRVKEAGKNGYRFFTEDMNAAAVERLALETCLRRAVDRSEFLLHYQPKVSLATGQVLGVEALIRWSHPERGLIAPDKFIPVAEETGLIVPIGEWVLRTACEQLRAWMDQGFTRLQLAVNLSARQFQEPGLVDTVAQALRSSGVSPNLLELELTETFIMANPEESIATLRALKWMGVRLSIDDFGTGYSSLSYLKRFPIDRIKIDRSFVQDVPDDPESGAIVSAIVALAHQLGLEVIAEGVETQRQLAFLRDVGCKMAQGYLLGRPVLPEVCALAFSKDERTVREA